MENKTGVIVGRLSREELATLVGSSKDETIRNKFLRLLMYMKETQEPLVISEHLK